MAVYYLAEKKGKIVASADLRKIGEGLDSVHFRVLGVIALDEYRNKGLGTKLIKLLIEWAKKKKIDFIELSVYEKNPDAKRLYERLGFKEVAVIPKRVKRGKEYIDDIIMHLYLK
jgi:GNAT superfamily N-acetyltransferase